VQRALGLPAGATEGGSRERPNGSSGNIASGHLPVSARAHSIGAWALVAFEHRRADERRLCQEVRAQQAQTRRGVRFARHGIDQPIASPLERLAQRAQAQGELTLDLGARHQVAPQLGERSLGGP